MKSTLIHNFLENSATQYPEKVAAIHDDQRATYGWLNTQADHLAVHLQSNKISKGDRIALLLENGIDYIIAYYAALKTGAVVAPLNPGLKPDGLQKLLNDLEPAGVIANFKSERLLKAIDICSLNLKLLVIKAPRQKWNDSPFAVSTLEESLAFHHHDVANTDIGTSDLASIIYTSGSTGQPKGVMLSHGNIASNTHSICKYLLLTHSDIQMVVLPFFYVMGKSLLNTHFAVGGSVVINNRFMYPASVLNQMIEEKVTGFSGVPSTYAYLLNRSPLASSKDKLTDLRFCCQAGGHMASALKLLLHDSLPVHTKIYIMYGATEASARLTYLDPSFFQSKIGSIGKPIPGVSISILDDMNHEVATGEEGMLVAQGPNIMMGYWKDAQDTQRVLTKYGYHTGDIGYKDSDGFLYVAGRKDGVLKTGGHRVNPIEIEDFLISTNLFVETAVIGIRDNLLEHKLVALVVPKNEAFSREQIMGKCAESLPIHKRPAVFLPARALPKNASGKVDREKCMQMALTQTSTDNLYN